MGKKTLNLIAHFYCCANCKNLILALPDNYIKDASDTRGFYFLVKGGILSTGRVRSTIGSTWSYRCSFLQFGKYFFLKNMFFFNIFGFFLASFWHRVRRTIDYVGISADLGASRGASSSLSIRFTVV